MSALHVFSSLPEDRFLCPICLNVFCDPVMTPCGHNFCKTCLVRTMDDGDEFCRCPKCNKRFHRMSEFSTNTVMAEISTQIKKRRVEAAENPDSPWQVKCDVCKDFKMKASKSCLRCVTSYCNAHLEPHQRVPSLTRHKLIDPVENLEEKHRRILELYCREEQVCVRLLCSEADHKDHKIVSVEEEAARQEETTESRTGEANRMIHSSEISKKIKACNKVFSTLVNKVQDKQIALALYMKKRLGKSKGKNDPLVKELQVEIAELQKKHSALEKLALCALSRVSNAKDSLKSRVYSDLYVQTAYRAMSHLMQTFQKQLRTLTGMELTRLRKYKEMVTFDPSTAGVHLAVTNFDTRLKHYKVARSSPSSDSKRFQLSLVLGKKGFTSGRHYWEVQVGRRGNWDVGVVKESVSRTLNFITEKNGFLTIGKREGEYRAYREFYEVINISPRPRKIGVYVDYGEGRVSFYETEQKRHIYSYKRVTFTEKLFPCFFLFSKARKSESITILSIKD